jgi:carboxylesterase type B
VEGRQVGRGIRQPLPALPSTNGPLSLTEDCLFLNVQRPAKTRSHERLPMYVWIHGGGLVNGSSNQHDGPNFVRKPGIIVVTINYRLGVLGSLAHPALTAAQGESGNYGFMDQQQALRWLRRNIAAFGGDPHRVTIGGESAGGFSECGHLSAPGSRGLFAGAVIESGICSSWPQADADSSADQVTSQVDCPATADPAAIACLRRGVGPGAAGRRQQLERAAAGQQHSDTAPRPVPGGHQRRLHPSAGADWGQP